MYWTVAGIRNPPSCCASCCFICATNNWDLQQLLSLCMGGGVFFFYFPFPRVLWSEFSSLYLDEVLLEAFCMYCWRSVVFWAALRCVRAFFDQESHTCFCFLFFSGRDGEQFRLLYRSSILGCCVRLGYDPVLFFVCLARSEFRFWCFGVGFWIWWSWLGFCEKVCWSVREFRACVEVVGCWRISLWMCGASSS